MTHLPSHPSRRTLGFITSHYLLHKMVTKHTLPHPKKASCCSGGGGGGGRRCCRRSLKNRCSRSTKSMQHVGHGLCPPCSTHPRIQAAQNVCPQCSSTSNVPPTPSSSRQMAHVVSYCISYRCNSYRAADATAEILQVLIYLSTGRKPVCKTTIIWTFEIMR